MESQVFLADHFKQSSIYLIIMTVHKQKITSQKSIWFFKNFNEFLLQVKNWVKELRKMLGNDICLCIAGNKIDLEKERHVSVADAEAYVISFSLVFRNWYKSSSMVV